MGQQCVILVCMLKPKIQGSLSELGGQSKAKISSRKENAGEGVFCKECLQDIV